MTRSMGAGCAACPCSKATTADPNRRQRDPDKDRASLPLDKDARFGLKLAVGRPEYVHSSTGAGAFQAQPLWVGVYIRTFPAAHKPRTARDDDVFARERA